MNTSALICGDAGDAGAVLTARSDVEVKWALTDHEALAVVVKARPDVCITREAHAPAILRAIGDPHAEPPVIVLLDEATLDEDRYRPGARAVVRARDRAAILDVCSQLTGLSFRIRPRVKLARFVEVLIGRERHLTETVDLSASGICLRDFPREEVGTVITLTLDAVTPPLDLQAILIRSYVKNKERRSGFAFTDLTAEQTARLDELVEQELEHAPPPDRAGDAANESDERAASLELVAALAWRAARKHESLAKPPIGLKRVAADLTAIERSALATNTAPEWAHHAIDLRLDLASGAGAAFTPEVLHFCGALAKTSAELDDMLRVEVAAIRGALLHDLSVATPGGLAPSARALLEAGEHPPGELDAEPQIISVVSAPSAPVERFVTLAEHERAYIERVLDAFGGDKTRAARALDITRAQLTRKLNRN